MFTLKHYFASLRKALKVVDSRCVEARKQEDVILALQRFGSYMLGAVAPVSLKQSGNP